MGRSPKLRPVCRTDEGIPRNATIASAASEDENAKRTALLDGLDGHLTVEGRVQAKNPLGAALDLVGINGGDEGVTDIAGGKSGYRICAGRVHQ